MTQISNEAWIDKNAVSLSGSQLGGRGEGTSTLQIHAPRALCDPICKVAASPELLAALTRSDTIKTPSPKGCR